jgi:hypothetical protein
MTDTVQATELLPIGRDLSRVRDGRMDASALAWTLAGLAAEESEELRHHGDGLATKKGADGVIPSADLRLLLSVRKAEATLRRQAMDHATRAAEFELLEEELESDEQPEAEVEAKAPTEMQERIDVVVRNALARQEALGLAGGNRNPRGPSA